jgi:hypothetical protein
MFAMHLFDNTRFVACLFLIAIPTLLCSCSAKDETVDAHDTDDEILQGLPLQAPAGQWTWFAFADTRCRDGSPAGLLINLSQTSSNVMIYLEEGGACFESATCSYNASAIPSDIATLIPDAGIFDRNNADNPVGDWSFVYIPYCTGDVHAGNRTDAIAPRVEGAQQYLGAANLRHFLSRLTPTFKDAQQVLYTGSSAGGFGVMMTAELMIAAFSPVPITVLSDSAPPMGEEQAPSCLQLHWRTLWGLDDSVLADCGDACPSGDDFMRDLALYGPRRHPGLRFGLISSTADWVIRRFLSAGAQNCHLLDPSLTPAQVATLMLDEDNQLSPQSYADGLMELRDIVSSEDLPFATFYIDSQKHVWLTDDDFYSTRADETSMANWVLDLLSDAGAHVGP